MTPRRSPLRTLLAAVLLIVAVSGCQLRLAVEVAIDRGGGGELSVSLGADPELQRRAVGAGVDPLGDVAAVGASLAEDGWTVQDVTDDDGARTVTLSRRFADPADFADSAGELADALAAPEVTPLARPQITVTDDQLQVSADAGLVPQPAVTELGLLPEDAVRVIEDNDAVDYRLSVRLPGAVLEHNADLETDDGALVWVVEPGESVEVRATGERPGAPWWWYATAAAAVAVLVAALLAVRAGRTTRPPRGGVST